MDLMLILALMLAFGVILYLICVEIQNAKDMRSLGLILIVVGLFFGWPIRALGVLLVIAHYFQQGNSKGG